MEFLTPWHARTDSQIVDELHREMAPGHVLENVDLSAIAYRQDCDEVLYAFNDGSRRFAAVHLTFCKTRETNPMWPRTWIFESAEKWLEYMHVEHSAWKEEDPDGQLWLKARELWDAAQKF